MAAKIAYIMSRFPHLPETFILREMDAAAQLGYTIAIYPLIRQRQNILHAESQHWVQCAQYSPYFSLPICFANLTAIFKKPRLYASIFWQILKENFTNPQYLWRSLLLYPKACYLAAQMRTAKIQHIHAHYATYPALVAWIIHQFTGIPYSVTVHAHDIYVSQVMLAAKLGSAAFIVAISEFNRQFLMNRVSPDLAAAIHVIHCGIDPQRYRPAPERPSITQRLEILSVGSLQPYKGQIHLLEACKLLKKRQIPFCCKIVGAGEQRHRLLAFIHEHHLDAEVALMGARAQTEVAAFLAAANCYVQPSIITPSGKMEGIPVSLMEALAASLPVVATEISGVAELVRPDFSGFLVPEQDALALADALETIYRNPDSAQKLAENGRNLVLREFNLLENVHQLVALFPHSNN